jgi:hypothetical protein
MAAYEPDGRPTVRYGNGAINAVLIRTEATAASGTGRDG